MSAPAAAPVAPGVFVPHASLYFFAWPLSKSVRLEKVFAVQSAACAEALAIASNQRDKVLAAMSHSLPQNVVAAIDEYVPYLQGMSEQVSSSGKIALKVSLDFLWTSSLLQKVPGETRYYLYHIFPEEAAHVFYLYGLALYALARNTALHGVEDAAKKAKTAAAAGAAGAAAAAAEAKGADYRVEVTRLMRSAAGVFRFMARDLLPTLSDRGSSKPPDVQVPVAEALADMCLAHAQEMTVESGLAKGTSEGLLAKLCVGVSEKFVAARSGLSRGLGHIFHGLDQGWNLFMSAKAELYLARSYKLLGMAAAKDAEHGKAVAYFNAAVAKLAGINPPQSNSSVQDVIREVASEHADAKARQAAQAHDNAKIYFALVPKEAADFPQALSKFIVSDIPYKQPAAAPGPFFDANWGQPVAAAAAAAPAMASGAAAGLPMDIPVAIPVSGSGSGAGDWSCAACTLSNKAASVKCDACGAARPAAAGGAAAASAPSAPGGPPTGAGAAAAAKKDAPPQGDWAQQLGLGANHSVTYAPQNF